jgi:hypothetical protein
MIARFALALATACLPLAAMAQDTTHTVETVSALFLDAFAEQCFWNDVPDQADYLAAHTPESWTLTWRPENAGTDMSQDIYRFFCFSGAYNVNHVYYAVDEVDGVFPIPFAVPDFDIAYQEDNFESPVEAITVTGYSATHMLTNSEFDPDTGTITNLGKWRGIGDASSGGTWAFSEGKFVLKTYDVDASYDGEVNPQRIVGFE